MLDGGQQRGMPTAASKAAPVSSSAAKVRLIVAVKDGNMQKTVIARPEHLRPLE